MKLTVFALLISLFVMPCWATGDLTDDFEEIIQDSYDPDLNLESVSLNPDADVINVNGFDIAGILLGMQFEDIQTLFFHNKALYVPRRNNSVIYTIHPDWKDNLDYECRQQNIVIPSELEKCINSLARSRGLLYASEVHLVRENTGETITVSFTSNATDNRVWGVVYNNDVNDMEGNAQKFANQRDKRITIWWQNVLDKYGEPNSGTDKWISSTNAYDPMMTAYYGSLELQDAGLKASDEAKNIQQARENFKAKPYSF